GCEGDGGAEELHHAHRRTWRGRLREGQRIRHARGRRTGNAHPLRRRRPGRWQGCQRRAEAARGFRAGNRQAEPGRAPREHQDPRRRPRRVPRGGRRRGAPASAAHDTGGRTTGASRCRHAHYPRATGARGRAQAREPIGARRQRCTGGRQDPDPEAGPDRYRRRRRRPDPVAGRPPLKEPDMIPASFEYHAPRTLDEAIGLLARLGDGAKILAGGQSLLPAMRFRLASPEVLVDINRLRDLAYVEERGDHLAIGALTREHQLEEAPIVARSYPLLLDTARVIADPLVRNRATVGGNLAHADPANDHPATMLAYDATIVARGPSGTRTIAIDDFFVGLFESSLQAGEVLT